MRSFFLLLLFVSSVLSGVAYSQTTETPSDLWSKQVGSGRLRLIDLSLDALVAGGWSTEGDLALQALQGGGHDPRKRGFTVQNVEMSLMGAVDPYFTGEAHLIYFLDPLSGESVFELEEAFFITQSLPWRLEIKGGAFFTEFGRLNPTHPHTWHWIDQPVINTRLFGPDGMRGAGLQISWLVPLNWYSELLGGVQNANGETMASFLASEEFFEERAIGLRPFFDREVKSPKDLVYLGRWENGFDVSNEISSKVGASILNGPNATGPTARTWIYGADLVLKWHPERTTKAWPFVVFESEFMKRDYEANSNGSLAAETLNDWGFYSQLLYGFAVRWVTGLRFDYATGSGESVGDRSGDPFRNHRYRISPLVAWHPTEFSRLRFQYNFDRADHIGGKNAHSAWFGVEFLYGSHPAHQY